MDSGATRGGTAATARPTVAWAYSAPGYRGGGPNRPCRPGSVPAPANRAIAGGGAHPLLVSLQLFSIAVVVFVVRYVLLVIQPSTLLARWWLAPRSGWGLVSLAAIAAASTCLMVR